MNSVYPEAVFRTINFLILKPKYKFYHCNSGACRSNPHVCHQHSTATISLQPQLIKCFSEKNWVKK